MVLMHQADVVRSRDEDQKSNVVARSSVIRKFSVLSICDITVRSMVYLLMKRLSSDAWKTVVDWIFGGYELVFTSTVMTIILDYDICMSLRWKP
ncbi:hypothetical protein L1887_35261 [Cichorium endivia]|nr:hypothetical protein L1887_35261 [Cichorium endivia]